MGILDRADVVNFAAVVALLIWFIYVCASLVFTWQTDAPWESLAPFIKDMMIIVLSILTTYGIVKARINGG
jgi:hypothetical protein